MRVDVPILPPISEACARLVEHASASLVISVLLGHSGSHVMVQYQFNCIQRSHGIGPIRTQQKRKEKLHGMDLGLSSSHRDLSVRGE